MVGCRRRSADWPRRRRAEGLRAPQAFAGWLRRSFVTAPLRGFDYETFQLSFVCCMRNTLFVSFAVIFTSYVVAIHADMNTQEKQLDGYAIFNDLSKEVASKKAQKMAETDFARNQYRIFVAGMRPPSSAYDDYLRKKYGILVTAIAGCVVSDGIMGALEGYNSTMKPLLNRKFGHDIFKEAEANQR